MPQGRKWTEKEYEYLEKYWGQQTIPEIAKKLKRTQNAVKLKIVRRGLGRAVTNAECLSAKQTSDLLGVDIHTVTDYWIVKCGLKYKKKAPHGTKLQIFIKVNDLFYWLKDNQDKWDSRKLDLLSFGPEPDWLKQKRKADHNKPPNKNKKWTKREDELAVMYYKQGKYTYPQIGNLLGRSGSAVEHRISRLDVWGSGKKKEKAI